MNRGYHVIHNTLLLGTQPESMRFQPPVNLSVIEFLAFENEMQNALSGLPYGGSQVGCNFDPKGRSEPEIIRFCHALATELGEGDSVRKERFLEGAYRSLLKQRAEPFVGGSSAPFRPGLRAEKGGEQLPFLV